MVNTRQQQREIQQEFGDDFRHWPFSLVRRSNHDCRAGERQHLRHSGNQLRIAVAIDQDDFCKRKISRGSKRMGRCVTGLVPCRPQKPVYMIKVSFPMRCLSLTSKNRAMPLLWFMPLPLAASIERNKPKSKLPGTGGKLPLMPNLQNSVWRLAALCRPERSAAMEPRCSGETGGSRAQAGTKLNSSMVVKNITVFRVMKIFSHYKID